MIVLRAALALAVAVVVQLAGVRLWPDFSRLVDPFLLVTIYFALSGRAGVAQLVGAAAGFTHAALAGTPVGLHAIADTLVGYGVAVAIDRFVVQRRGIETLLFTLGAAAQQSIVVLLLLGLLDDPELPAAAWMLGKIAATGVLGTLLVVLASRLRGRWGKWRRERRDQLRA